MNKIEICLSSFNESKNLLNLINIKIKKIIKNGKI